MLRYFIEVAYKGTRYSGFQAQDNAETIQSKVEGALQTIYKQDFQQSYKYHMNQKLHLIYLLDI